MPAVTGRTRRRFASALGSGKNAAAHKTACTTRVCRGGSLLCGWGAFRLSASWLCQDEDSLFIAQDLGEVKRGNGENAGKLTHISGNLWVDYVILVVMTLVSAIAVEWFWKCVPVQKLSGLLMKEKAV